MGQLCANYAAFTSSPSPSSPATLALMASRSSPILCAAEARSNFYAFDLLWLNGRDHRCLPLLERERRLREIVPAPSPLPYVDHVVGTGGFVRGRLPE